MAVLTSGNFLRLSTLYGQNTEIMPVVAAVIHTKLQVVLSLVFINDIPLWYINIRKKTQTINHSLSCHFFYFLLHVSAFSESQRQTIKNVQKER